MASKGKSPKTPKSKSSNKRESFTPSPSQRDFPRSRPTCDVAKRVRDLCATWHELVQKWTNLNSLGTTVANKLMNLQLQKQYSDLEDSNSVTVMNDMSQTASSDFEEQVLKTLEELSKILSKMAEIHKKMESLTKSFQAAEKLKQFKEKEDLFDHETETVFNTWPVNEYYSSSEKLHTMFGKELELKQKIFPYFTKTNDRNILLVYLSLWLHEPYLSDEKDVLLESMLIETELR
ncbi:cyclin-dependent kinase 2-interacting protein-like [Actinia tenebrosa]|uniref:Cyclin-dependent kinase 2-interacting protein-like n=1 Tax=Actinia tenebrosa TaxID=6105 RepID=A0A6P8HEB6_ACTTE|nr:cyclin-dependent kinase 2-interacting protein-like [Actinia tenebrosa]